MKKINSLKDSSFHNDASHEEDKEINKSHNNFEKVLCNHCGRTSENGIRCLGICVSDSDY